MRLRVAADGTLFEPQALPLTISIDGELIRVGPLDDHALADLLADAAWDRLIPGTLTDEDHHHLAARIADRADRLDWFHLWRAATDVLDLVCGMPWYTAMRLVRATRQHWLVFHAWSITQGFSPDTAALHRLLAAAYAWAMTSAGGEESKTRRLHAELFAAPSQLGALYADVPHPWMIHDEHAQLLDL